MATITATVGLKDLEDFYATDGGFPSGTGSYSGGYSAKSATSGDTISITVYQHSSVNVGYTPTVQLVNTGGSASVSGSFGTSVTVTVTNVTGTGEIRILSAPGTSAGFTPAASQRYRAIIDLTVSASIVAPAISSVTTDNPTSPNVTATVNLSSNGSGGTLEYARGTHPTTPPSTGWQTSNQFTHARGDAWYYFASQDRNNSGFSTGRYLSVGYIAPNLTVTPTPTAETLSSTNPLAAVTIGDVASYEEVAVRINNGTTNLATATGNNQTLSWGTSLPSQGATVTYEVFLRVPTASGGDGVWVATNTTFTRTRAVLDTNIAISNYSGPTRYYSNGTTVAASSTVVIMNYQSSYTHNLTGCGSETVYYASYTSGASAGSQAAYSTLSPIGRTWTTASSRELRGMSSSAATLPLITYGTGDIVYLWAVAKGDSSITNSSVMTYTGNYYYVERPDTLVTVTPSTTSLGSVTGSPNGTGDTTSPTVNVTNDSSGTQYRLYSSNISRWVSTYNGGGVSNTDFTISYAENPDGSANSSGTFTELPANGGTYTYTTQCRVTSGTPDPINGGGAAWVEVNNSGESFTITRGAAPSYTVTGPTGGTVNEGQNLTFSITTSNVANNTTVGWTLSGLQSGDYTTSATSPANIQNNSATVTFAIVNDNVTDGNKTATLTLAPTDSTGASTGSPTPSASVTVVDTSNPGGGSGQGTGTGGGGAGTYGLLIRNSDDTQTIIDGSSRVTNFLASDFIDTNSQSSKTMFTNFDCSEKTEIGFLVSWDGALFSNPTITRRSSSLGGIEVTKNANDTGSSTAGTAVIELVRF